MTTPENQQKSKISSKISSRSAVIVHPRMIPGQRQDSAEAEGSILKGGMVAQPSDGSCVYSH
jgi:hypothetical protein